MPRRVLVVDDDKPVTRFFERVLQEEDCQVLAAHDGHEALAVFREELPDLVFLDLMLPRVDGAKVCDGIRSSFLGLLTPIVFMTGLEQEQGRIELIKRHGVIDYLTKPASVEKILSLTKWALSPASARVCPVQSDPLLKAVELDAQDPEAVTLGGARLCELLRLIARRKMTGSLVAARGKMRRALVFEEGRLTTVRSNVIEDRLDRTLRKMRKVTPKEVASLSDTLASDQDEVAQELVRSGVLSDEELRQALLYQALNVGLRLFQWPTGVARFLPDESLPGTELSAKMSAQNLLLLCLRCHYTLQQKLEQELPSDSTALVRVASQKETSAKPGSRQAPRFDLTRTERHLLELVGRGRDVGEMKRIASLAQVDAVPSLAVLLGAGLLEEGTNGRPARATLGWPRLEPPPVPDAGDSTQTPIVVVVGSIIARRRTGSLTVHSDIRRALFFEKGELVFARSTHPDERIGRVLEGFGLKDTQIGQAIADQLQHNTDLRLGSILVRGGTMTLDQLDSALRSQLNSIWHSALCSHPCQYRFEGDPLRIGTHINPDRSMLELVRDGIRRVDRPRIDAHILELGNRVVSGLGDRSPEVLSGLSPLETRLLEQISSGFSGLDPHRFLDDDQALRAMFLLVCMGAARVMSMDPSESATPAEEQADPDPLVEVDWATATDEPQCPPTAVAMAPPANTRGTVSVEYITGEFYRYRLRSENALAGANQDIGRLQERIRQLEAELKKRT